MNLLQLKLLQVALFFTFLIINHINVEMVKISMKKVNWNQLILKFSTLKNQTLFWESFTDIHPWILLALIAVT